MKKLFIGLLLTLTSTSAFAQRDLSFLTEFGDRDTILKQHNYDDRNDKLYSLLGSDNEADVTERCRELVTNITSWNPSNTQILGILIQDHIGANDGTCLIKMELNF